MFGWILFFVVVIWKIIKVFNVGYNSHPSFLWIYFEEWKLRVSIVSYRKTMEDKII